MQGCISTPSNESLLSPLTSLHLHSFPDVLRTAVLVQMFPQPGRSQDESPCAALISLKDNTAGERKSDWFSTRPREQLCWHNTESRRSPCTPPRSGAPSLHQLAGSRLDKCQCHGKATLPHLHPVPPRCCAPSWFHVSELRALSLPS